MSSRDGLSLTLTLSPPGQQGASESLKSRLARPVVQQPAQSFLDFDFDFDEDELPPLAPVDSSGSCRSSIEACEGPKIFPGYSTVLQQAASSAVPVQGWRGTYEDEYLPRTVLAPGDWGQCSAYYAEGLPQVAPSSLQRGTLPAETQRSIPGRHQTSVDRPSAKAEKQPIDPPYEWATDRRAVVYTLGRMEKEGIGKISGDVICKKCDRKQEFTIPVRKFFLQLDSYFVTNRDTMHDRAPKTWMVPRLLDCSVCEQIDCVRPIIHTRKRRINWLFLMLTGTLGLCTLDQLKYFCKHNHQHRTGAKDRVLYLTYLGLFNQLEPGHYC